HARQRLAGMFIIVAEKFEMTGMNEASFTLDLPFESGNPFVDQTRRRRIVADDNKDRRNSDAGALPLIKLALVVIVERIESGREQIGKPVAGIELRGLAGALLRHLLADVIPKIAEHRRVSIHRIIADRHAG